MGLIGDVVDGLIDAVTRPFDATTMGVPEVPVKLPPELVKTLEEVASRTSTVSIIKLKSSTNDSGKDGPVVLGV